MTDIENIVFDGLKKHMLAKFSDLKENSIRSEHMNSPPVFPCIMAYESSNSTLEATSDEHGEHHANLRYTIEVYTNNKNGKKQKGKELANAIDAYMLDLGFLRASKQYTIGANEATTFVVTCSYRCVAGESYSGDDNTIMIYRR